MKNSYQKKAGIKQHTSLNNIQQLLFCTQLILIISIALILGIASVLINVQYETEKRDRNLQNIAQAIARSPLLTEYPITNVDAIVAEYLDTLKDTLDDIDVISVVNSENLRIYHTTASLIGTEYNGNLPVFSNQSENYYTVDEFGPSGSQRRAYAAIYDENDDYVGFVMAIMLTKNIKAETIQMIYIFLIVTVVTILIELLIAGEFSEKIKKSLMGYEPNVFATMYKMRDNILETLKEGILAIDAEGMIQFANTSAMDMLFEDAQMNLIGKSIDTCKDRVLINALKNGNKEFNITLSRENIILDTVPLKENGHTVGAIAILHNRSEYIKLMEDLSGTRYLVDSMRANNHDFTNKLHVILGLIQMEMYDEAISYIQNITMVQRENISKIMNAVSEPSIAALLIGKLSRASELNVNLILREGCCYSSTDMNLPAEMLVTIIGNLLDNAFDALNETADFLSTKELIFGIYSRPGAVLITIDDTGSGISKEHLPYIFQNGYSTKGTDRGTGLYQVKTIVENLGGKISVESQEQVGTSFSISFIKEHKTYV